MKIEKDDLCYEIGLHYNLRKLCLNIWKKGERNYIEFNGYYTMPELCKKLSFISFGSPECCAIQEMDAHIDTLNKIHRREDEIAYLREELKKFKANERNILLEKINAGTATPFETERYTHEVFNK